MKSTKPIFWIIALIVLTLLGYITVESLSQPGLERFKGEIEEMDFYRNENNTGPVIRIYAVKYTTFDQSLFEAYGDAMPHTKYGKTIVYFFAADQVDQVKLDPNPPFLSEKWQMQVAATYSKSPMGDVHVVEKFVP
ncbi:hypothetical protein [Algoriphagus namhaensis]